MDGTSTKIDLKYADKNVVFRITDCCTQKKYSLCKLSRGEAEELVYSLKEKEKKTWKQLSSAPRNTGITPEKKDSISYEMIDRENTSLSKIAGKKYYFHLRTKARGVYRIFGYQEEEYFFITHIDTKGEIHCH